MHIKLYKYEYIYMQINFEKELHLVRLYNFAMCIAFIDVQFISTLVVYICLVNIVICIQYNIMLQYVKSSEALERTQ